MSETDDSDDVSRTDISLHSQMGARPSSPRPLPASAHRVVMGVDLARNAQPERHLPSDIGRDGSETDGRFEKTIFSACVKIVTR